MTAESSFYISGDSLEEIYELLGEGFFDNNADLNKELDAVTSTEENDDKKKVFKCTVCGKKMCFFSRIKETYNSETCPGRSYTNRTKKYAYYHR